MDRMLGFEPSGVGSIPAGPASIPSAQNVICVASPASEGPGAVTR